MVSNYSTTPLLTPWSRVLLEKLASLQLVKKFPAFYGTRRFLTALTSNYSTIHYHNPKNYILHWIWVQMEEGDEGLYYDEGVSSM